MTTVAKHSFHIFGRLEKCASSGARLQRPGKQRGAGGHVLFVSGTTRNTAAVNSHPRLLPVSPRPGVPLQGTLTELPYEKGSHREHLENCPLLTGRNRDTSLRAEIILPHGPVAPQGSPCQHRGSHSSAPSSSIRTKRGPVSPKRDTGKLQAFSSDIKVSNIKKKQRNTD